MSRTEQARDWDNEANANSLVAIGSLIVFIHTAPHVNNLQGYEKRFLQKK